jgi:extracellular matrix protein 14
MLLRRCILLAALVYFDLVGAATIQKRSPSTPATAASRSWTDRLRDVFYRPQGGAPQQQMIPAGDNQPHPLSHYVHDIVLRFNVTGSAEAAALADAVNNLYLDVWSATDSHVDIRMHRGTVPLLLDLLPESMRDSHAPLVQSLADVALETYPGGVESPAPRPPLGLLESPVGEKKAEADILFFQDYQPHNVIVAWMKLLESLFPSHVELITIGHSFEGRKIHALKVGTMKPAGEKKKTIVINGAAHAREWISVSTVCYLAYAMITGFSRDDKVIDTMVNEFDWIFLPTLNVDGYVYTWEQDRLWRKNRQPTSLAFCKGIDLDRAYNFHFDASPVSASNPCSEMFPGSYPFQAQESREFAHWAEKYTKDGTKIAGLLDMHSYAQSILYPYSYSCNHRPPDLENLEELAMGLAKAIRIQSGEHYEVAAACAGTGFASFPGTTGGGSMLDYFYAKMKVPFTFQIKLRDSGSHGFLLPKENIIPTGAEIFNLLKYFSQFLMDDGSPTSTTPSDEL